MAYQCKVNQLDCHCRHSPNYTVIPGVTIKTLLAYQRDMLTPHGSAIDLSHSLNGLTLSTTLTNHKARWADDFRRGLPAEILCNIEQWSETRDDVLRYTNVATLASVRRAPRGSAVRRDERRCPLPITSGSGFTETSVDVLRLTFPAPLWGWWAGGSLAVDESSGTVDVWDTTSPSPRCRRRLCRRGFDAAGSDVSPSADTLGSSVTRSASRSTGAGGRGASGAGGSGWGLFTAGR